MACNWLLTCCCSRLCCCPCTAPQWFYDNKPLQYTKMVNGSSYKRWKLPLPVMSTLYRLAGQVRTALTARLHFADPPRRWFAM